MSFISYSQNYEDVMLIRALGGVEHGFYIDVGAQDPVEHSVTKAFYEIGWHGINIEPVKHWFDLLATDRSHDINLQLAASDKAGRLHLYEIADTGLSTTNCDFAERHAKTGFSVGEIEVDCLTLDEICERYSVELVHFLKIDCEGAEAAVLSGFSLTRVRPWIILVEATEPLSQTPTYMGWESLLTGRGYHFVYRDGLNRFYVADEHGELDQAFSHPPNVFDDFVRAPDAVARQQLEASRGELRALHDVQRVERLESEAEQLRAGVEHLRSENERREAALVEHRRKLEEAAEREAAATAEMQGERAQLRSDLDYLESENERREAALVEQRRQLEESAAREAAAVAEIEAERARLRGDLDYLRIENERCEGASIELRRLLTEAREREAASATQVHAAAAQWRIESEGLRNENERLNLALLAQREAMLACEMRLAASGRDLALAVGQAESLGVNLVRCQADLASLRAVNEGAGAEVLELHAEVGRLHHEVLIRDREVVRLHEFIRLIHASISWRITFPLRVARRGASALLSAVLRVGYGLLRWLAHLVRPLIRWLARWSWLRSVAVRILGSNSKLTVTARLFLFGSAPIVPADEQREIVQSNEHLTRRAAQILEEIHEVRKNELHVNSSSKSGRK